MAVDRRILTSACAGLAAIAFAGGAQAGGAQAGGQHGSSSGCSTCGSPPTSSGCNTCTTPTPPANDCGCTVPTHHRVYVPGVWFNESGVGYSNASSGSESSSSASASAQASSNSSASSYASLFASLNAAGNGVIYNGGGGSGFYVEQGAGGAIPNLNVESAEARQVCAEMRAVVKMAAIQAVCLDDKEVPHPASQVMPDRDVPETYEGEVYRCIAGARMQYTIGAFAGQASFDHGQTITCDKFQALYHTANGGLACRVQKKERDCNERSLLRRYGAGIKVVKIAAAQQCVAYRTETVAAQSGPAGLVTDGGVGGVAH